MNLKIRKAEIADTEAYICLLHEVKNAMAYPDWFCIDPDEKVRAMMEDGSMEMWIAECEDQIVGAFSIVVPGLEPHNLGNDLNFSEEDLKKVVHMDTAAVHPNYRGLGLQYRLMMEAEKELTQSGHRILLCTVHPDNQYSLQNVLKQGYAIMVKKEKYGSIRYILRKDIS